MTSPATIARPSELQTALLDVQTTLSELLAAADEQYEALTARDRDRLETITGRQERLSARLARAERHRMDVLAGRSLRQAIVGLPRPEARRLAMLAGSIARAIKLLQRRNARATSLLERTIELNAQTLNFIQRLVTVQNPVYGKQRVAPAAVGNRQSLLVDGRA